VHVLKSGCRWIDAPAVYGPRKTLYNRFVRWAAKDVWVDIFDALASAGGPPAEVLIDSSAVKAHRCASGGKGGSGPRGAAQEGDGNATSPIYRLVMRWWRRTGREQHPVALAQSDLAIAVTHQQVGDRFVGFFAVIEVPLQNLSSPRFAVSW
jgi:transposase